MKDFFSEYSLEARVFPTIVGLLPFYLVQYFYLNNFFNSDIFQIEILGDISLSLVILYFFTEFPIRYIGKLYEDKIFNKKINFPTTNFFMYGNKEYTSGFKKQLRKKIKEDFSLVLMTEKEEVENEKEARRKIKEVIGLMIGKVKDGHLVLKQNIAYGFVRNLWASSIFGIIFSLLLVIFSFKDNHFISYLGIVLIILYLSYLLFGKLIIDYFGKNYARKLIEEYYKS